MADFNMAIKAILGDPSNEGGLSDNSNDPGGITKYGISLRFLKGIEGEKATRDRIINLSQKEAIEIYKDNFWLDIYNSIESQAVAKALLDMGINAGTKTAVMLLQRACWSVLGNKGDPVDDGVLGNKTLACVNKLGDMLVYSFRSERAGYYRAVASLNKSAGVFIQGWLSRAYRN